MISSARPLKTYLRCRSLHTRSPSPKAARRLTSGLSVNSCSTVSTVFRPCSPVSLSVARNSRPRFRASVLTPISSGANLALPCIDEPFASTRRCPSGVLRDLPSRHPNPFADHVLQHLPSIRRFASGLRWDECSRLSALTPPAAESQNHSRDGPVTHGRGTVYRSRAHKPAAGAAIACVGHSAHAQGRAVRDGDSAHRARSHRHFAPVQAGRPAPPQATRGGQRCQRRCLIRTSEIRTMSRTPLASSFLGIGR